MTLERCVLGMAYKITPALKGIYVEGCRIDKETNPKLVRLSKRNPRAIRRTVRADGQT
jgi:hypothetical protein